MKLKIIYKDVYDKIFAHITEEQYKEFADNKIELEIWYQLWQQKYEQLYRPLDG